VDVLVNVGANVGCYCCHALSLDKRVVAIEPIARNLHYLLRNVVENGWAQQCEIFPVALAAQTDVLRMWGGLARCGSSCPQMCSSYPPIHGWPHPLPTVRRASRPTGA
jgi:FkbM family methyltransferase